MEKAHHELQERHAKTYDDVSRIIEMLAILTKGKQNEEASNPQVESTPMRNTVEDLLYPPGFTLPRETQTTYTSPSQPIGLYPYPYGPPQIIQTLGLVLREPNADANPISPLMVLDLDDPIENEKLHQNEAQEKYKLLEERLRAMEGINIPGGVDAAELSLVHGLAIPHKFKTPVFDKYDGAKCSTTHLTMYCKKISAHMDNDKLLIYYFQDSLIGIAAQWYLKLDRNHIRS